MDPQQILPLQLLGNNFAMSPGGFPKLREGYNGGGGKVTQLNQQNMTSSAYVSSRLNPADSFRCPLNSLDQHDGTRKVGIRSTGCSPSTTYHSGPVFPWMNQRTTDKSGKSDFIHFEAIHIFPIKLNEYLKH